MDDLTTTLGMQDWYWYLVVVLTGVIQIARKNSWTKQGWEKIPEGLRWLPGATLSFSVGFVQAAAEGATFDDAVLAGFGAILGIALPSMGLAAALRESQVPWDGGAGGHVRRTLIIPAAMFLALGAVPTLTSCVGPTDPSAAIRRYEVMAYNTAVSALEVLDAEQAARNRAVRERTEPPVTEAEYDKLAAATERLKRIHAALSIANSALQAKATEITIDKALGDAIALLALALDEGAADGLALPPAMRDGVRQAAAMFRGAP